MAKEVLYVVVVAAAYTVGRAFLQTRSAAGAECSRHAIATLTAFALIAATSVLQFVYPSMLAALRRDTAAVVRGEPWRLVTALCVQDGGVAGTVFNLAALLLIGMIAERMFGTRRWIVVFAVGAVLSEIVALRWQPVGAGNSVGNFSLAGAICVWCLSRKPNSPVAATALLPIVAGTMLLVMRDIHGAAIGIGGILGASPIVTSRGTAGPASSAPSESFHRR